ncbi:MAG: OadG-related small transporter subunit [Candidatus Fimadaptatus sp.]
MSNIEKFLATLPIMLQGMAGIFIVLIAIYLVIFALNRLTSPRADRPDAGESAAKRAD